MVKRKWWRQGTEQMKDTGNKREGALEDKEKCDEGEGLWARCWRIARVSLSVTIARTLKDAAASVKACVRDRRTVPIRNVLESVLQNNMTCWVMFQKYSTVLVFFDSLLRCVTLRCLVPCISECVFQSMSALVFHCMNIALSVISMCAHLLPRTSSLVSPDGTQNTLSVQQTQSFVFTNEMNHVKKHPGSKSVLIKPIALQDGIKEKQMFWIQCKLYKRGLQFNNRKILPFFFNTSSQAREKEGCVWLPWQQTHLYYSIPSPLLTSSPTCSVDVMQDRITPVAMNPGGLFGSAGSKCNQFVSGFFHSTQRKITAPCWSVQWRTPQLVTNSGSKPGTEWIDRDTTGCRRIETDVQMDGETGWQMCRRGVAAGWGSLGLFLCGDYTNIR